MTQNVSGWLPNLIGPVVIQDSGTAKIARGAMNFIGCVITDDPSNDRTNITPTLASLSSATLAAALTDETGTGVVVFGTAPIFKTTITLRNPADTFSYVITPGAIGASRIISFPALVADDSFVFAAAGQTLTNKTLVAASNTITDTSATTGDILRHNGTKFVRLARGSANQVLTTNAGATDIAWATPASGAASVGGSGQVDVSDGAGGWSAATAVLAGASFISIGATPSTTGAIRVPSASAGLKFRNAANTADMFAVTFDGADNLYIGTGTAFATASQVTGLNLYAVSSVALGLGGTTMLYVTGTNIEAWRPMVGGSSGNSPWGAVDGISRITVAASNITLTSAQYSRFIHKFTGAPAATRTITYPLPTTDDECYRRLVWPQQTVSTLTITNGGGLTVSLAANAAPKLLLFAQEGVIVLA